MIYPNTDTTVYIAESKMQEQVQRHISARMLSDAGIDQRGLFIRSSARMLYMLGHQLVRLGHRLETRHLADVTAVPQMQSPAFQIPCD
jgi:hypothetical protein